MWCASRPLDLLESLKFQQRVRTVLIHSGPENGVGVVGLGYVGLPLVASLASVGLRVVGVDINEAKMRQLRESAVPDFYEFGLQELLGRYRMACSQDRCPVHVSHQGKDGVRRQGAGP